MSAIGNHLTNDEILSEIGGRLRARRLERDLTVEFMSEQTGLNRKTILDAENGRDVRFSTLIKLLRVMNLLGALDAALPDTLPGNEAFSSRGRLRQRASSASRRKQDKRLLLLPAKD